MDLSTIKSTAILLCKSRLKERIQSFDQQLRELAAGAQNESKSSAGDKHETARAMAQLEQEKLGKQLHETQIMLQELERVPLQTKSDTIIQGSLINTNQGLIFIAVAYGKLDVAGQSIMVISLRSPLAMQLQTKRKKESITFNATQYTVIDFC